MRRSVSILIGSTILFLLLACVLLTLIMRPSAEAQVQERRNAVARWEKRTFSKYRMVLEDGNCTTDYEVVAEHVSWGYETPCGRGQARPVASLFALIEPDRSVCVGTGCPCERVTSLQVRYDTILGYPQRIIIRNQIWPNWQSGAFWNALTTRQGNPCSGGNERVLTVRGLTPRT
ncbi:MAG: hypothetical protein SH847_19620 [Roseiflexaceae bacterium]|nr:hypothetical protein [Roseiflexaceae bacterium]